MHRIWRKHRKYENYLFPLWIAVIIVGQIIGADQEDSATAYDAGFMFGSLAASQLHLRILHYLDKGEYKWLIG